MIAGLACLIAFAQGAAPKADTALIADVTTIKAGAPFTVALQMKLPPDWHSYYLNPGDAGQATAIAWKLPPGFTAGAIQWPVPMREDVSGIPSYVYENEVWLLTKITPPKTLAAGLPIHIGAHVTWLQCSSMCVPMSSDLTLDLAAGAAAQTNEDQAANFVAAEKAIPIASSKIKVGAQLGVVKNGVRIVVRGLPNADGVRFISADVDSFGASEAKSTAIQGGVTLDLPLSQYAKAAPPRIKGILVTPAGAFAIDTPVVRV